jgi:hypothetical protein
MSPKELSNALNSLDQFKEIWLYGQNGESLCALINGNYGWLMFLRHEGDSGYSSRNPNAQSGEEINYMLANGQEDFYPKNWAYPIEILSLALHSFLKNNERPAQVQWHDDSV